MMLDTTFDTIAAFGYSQFDPRSGNDLQEIPVMMLSGTWTSFGSGIENNWVTSNLAKICQQVLVEELEWVRSLGDRDR